MTDLTKIGQSVKATRLHRTEKTIGFLIKNDSDEQLGKKTNEKFQKYVKQHDENEFTAVYANQNDELNTTDEEEDQEDEDDDQEVDDDDEDDPKNDYFNTNLKIEENLSFIEDDYETIEDFVENGKVHASINQYKQKFLGSVIRLK